MQKKFLTLSFFIFFSCAAFAQKLQDVLPKEANSFAAITAFADSFFANNGSKLNYNNAGVAQESDYLKYRRWQYYWKNRIMPDGSFPDAMHKYAVYKDLNSKKIRANTWENFSQTTSESGYNGMGRVLSVAFHPTDSNTMYITAPKGGIWKTTNGGNTWTAKGDALPALFTGKVVVDNTNGNTLYVSLGDNTNWVYNDPSLGIYKSVDGGDTWTTTGQTYTHQNNVRINDLAMLQNNNTTIASAQNNGLFVSNDAGATWVLKQSGNFKQVISKPFSNAKMYALQFDDVSNNCKLFSTSDSGQTWTQIYTFSHNTGSVNLATTIADSNFLAATFSSDSTYLYTSNNQGVSFNFKGGKEDADYIGISANNKNIMYIGGVSSYKSTNGGTTFSKLTHWYDNGIHTAVHADAHYYASNPITKKMFYCNDGGIYRYNELNDTWKDLSNGLVITQFYKCAISQIDSTYVVGGTQDNGGRQLNAGVWSSTNGGDAMEQATDIVDENVAFTTYVDGELYKTYDRWANSTTITPDANDMGSWVTPYLVHPVKDNIMVAAYSKIYKSNTNGNGWFAISNFLLGNNNANFDCVALYRNDEITYYASAGAKLYATFNDGANWANKVTPDGNTITELYVHPKNNKIIYFSKSGYSDAKKVYKSVDGGLTFTNISYNLPNIPINTIIVDQESDSANVEIYIGTDVGVFYKKELDNSWTYYNTGLPNTEVSDLEIQYASGLLIASTYGRGMWRTHIARPIPVVIPASINNTPMQETMKASMAYVNNKIILQVKNNNSKNVEYQIIATNGQLLFTKNTNQQNGDFIIATENLPSGNYFLQLINATKQSALQFSVQ
jgi:photosystem II stability/assembly factor-like uncharacterized protein